MKTEGDLRFGQSFDGTFPSTFEFYQGIGASLIFDLNQAEAIFIDFGSQINSNIEAKTLMLNDSEFDGLTKEFELLVPFYSKNSNGVYYDLTYYEDLKILFGDGNEASTKYLLSVNAAGFGGGFFSEPVSIQSSVENGIGTFGFFSRKRFKLGNKKMVLWDLQLCIRNRIESFH